MIIKVAICFVGTLIRLEGGKNGRETKKSRNRLFCGDWRSGGSVNFDAMRHGGYAGICEI